MRQSLVWPTSLRRRARGLSFIYVVLILIPLIGFAAFAVDMGRIRLARAELQTAADAAARAGAAKLPWTTSRNRGNPVDPSINEAHKAAQKNQCLGQDVSLTDSEDLIFGIWNPTRREDNFDTSQPLAQSNAVQVITRRTTARGNPIRLYIAPILGTSTNSIETTAIAYIDGNPDEGYAIFGRDGISANGNRASVDGSIASNGDIDLGNADVVGDVRAGGEISNRRNSNISGWQGPLFTPLRFPNASIPWDATEPDWGSGQQNGGGNGNGKGDNDDITINGSFNPNNPKDYKVIGPFNPDGDIKVSGYVAIYVDGDVKFNGNQISEIDNPMNLRIYVVGNHDVDIGGNVTQKFELYAPQSTVTIHGNATLYGSIIGKSVTLRGNVSVHGDRSNPFGPLPPYKITLVH